MDILTYGLIALTIFLLLYLLLSNLLKGRMELNRRLDDIGYSDNVTSEFSESSIFREKRESYEGLFRIPLLGSYLRKSSEQLLQAHMIIKPLEFLLFSIISAALFFFIIYAVTKNALVGIMPAIIGFIIPRIIVSRARNKRALKLSDQLPEFLNILSNALRAGLSFNQAITTASSEMEDPIKWEFQKVLRDNNLGRPFDESLLELVKRTGDDDVEMLVSAIIIQRQVGGNLSEVLDMIASTIRDRVRIKGEVRALTAQSRLSAIIIGVLPVAMALILSVINPEYLKPLFTEIFGRILLGFTVLMVITGVVIINKVIQLEV